MAIGAAVAAARQVDHAVHLGDQAGTQLLHAGDPAVMGDVHDFRRFGQDPAQRCTQRVRVELHRRRAGHDVGATRRVQFAVGNPEGVAAEPAAAARVPHRQVVAGVARRVHAAQRAPAQVEDFAIGHAVQARFGNGHQRPVVAVVVLPVDRAGAGLQPGRIDHVPRTVRMHGEGGVGQLAHQRPGAAGVVQVHVGGDHPVDVGRLQAVRLQRRQQARHALAGPGVDERRAPALDHQVGGTEPRPHVSGVDGDDAVLGRHDRLQVRVR